MPNVTQLLDAAAAGDSAAAADLLPLVYDELRQLAAARMAVEQPNHTLQATALVHEAYLRLVGPEAAGRWQHRGHFFAAAAEAMRRVLIDHARRRGSDKRGRHQRATLDLAALPAEPGEWSPDDVLALDDALRELAAEDPGKARLVELRFFTGLTLDAAAQALGISPATAKRHWAYARAFLYGRLRAGE